MTANKRCTICGVTLQCEYCHKEHSFSESHFKETCRFLGTIALIDGAQAVRFRRHILPKLIVEMLELMLEESAETAPGVEEIRCYFERWLANVKE